jgi:SEC-C motif-containing protein
LHDGSAAAATAEQLMRSRYSAFALGDARYLLGTWHSSTRPAILRLDPDVRWTALEMLDTVRGSLLDQDGIVEFRAHHTAAGAAGAQHERSRFIRDGGTWWYLDGVSLS